MSEGPFVTGVDFEEHLRSDPKKAHGIWSLTRGDIPGEIYSKSEVDAFFEGEASGKKQVDWARITSKPGTYPPSAHTHDDRYYTETELNDGQLDTRYYTKTQINTYLEAQDELSEMDDVNITSLQNNQVLVYNYSLSEWQNASVPTHAHAHGDLSGITDDQHHSKIHAASHKSAGGDAIRIDELKVATDITTLNATTTYHGLLPKLYGGTARFFRADGIWATLPDADPTPHASDHEVGGDDLVSHDDLTDFVGAEHLSLPNSLANVINSGHDKDEHDSLGLDHGALSGKADDDHSQYHNDTRGDVRYYTKSQINTYLEAQDELAEMDDVNITTPADNQLLVYNFSLSEWQNAGIPSHTSSHDHDNLTNVTDDQHHSKIHAVSHKSAGGDAIRIDELKEGTDVTTLDSTTTRHGLFPKLYGGTARFLRSDGVWATFPDADPTPHASDHEVGGDDLVSHDQLTDFATNEHLVLPNSLANVINSGHDKTEHDGLGLDHGALSGKGDDDHSQYHNDTRGDTRYYTKSQINTYLEAQDELAEMDDVNITTPQDAQLLVYNYSLSEWQNAGVPTHTHDHADLTNVTDDQHHSKIHAVSHKSAGGDAIRIDELKVATDITTLNATTTYHGLLPKLYGGTARFLRADGTWAITPGGTPDAHADSHEVGGSDLVSHDLLTDFVSAEHLSLPNSLANVINSGHDKDEHDSLGLDHGALSGKGDDDHAQYHNDTRGDARYYTKTQINTYLEAQDELSEMDDVNITTPANNALLVYNSVAGEWQDGGVPTHAHAHGDLTGIGDDDHHSKIHAVSHKSAGGDAIRIDELKVATDITTLNATTSYHGLLPKLYGGTARFLRSDGTWAITPGGEPDPHASDHEVGGDDLVSHDSLTDFVAAEHLSLPNSMANVINSGHDADLHDGLGLDHGFLVGKGDDDHTQYILASGTRAFTGVVSGITPTVAAHLATKGYVDGQVGGVNEFVELTDTPANYTGSAGKFVKVNATPDALVFASIAWADVSKTGSNLTDLVTRQHAGLTDVTANQHHDESHTLASHSTKAHSELSDAPADAHHAQLHASEHEVGGGDLVSHDDLTDFVSGEHFLQSAITTVGTIGTGVWQGTPIANAYIAGINQNLLTTSSPAFDGISARRFTQVANGVPTNNLGSPTVTEMALFETQFNNKTEFYNINNLKFYTYDGTWTEYTAFSDTNKRRFLGGDINSGINIPNLTEKFRIEITNSGAYVYLNALYMYWSSNSHNTTVHIWRRYYATQVWSQLTSSTATISSWPGHMYLPHPGIAFHPSSDTRYDAVRIEFTPNWSGDPTYGHLAISLYRLQFWGGYPAGKRRLYSIDEYKKATFPGEFAIGTINAGVSDYDKFLVSDGGLVKYRTGAQVLADIGASGSGHSHAHSAITDVTSDQHHAQLHAAEHEVGGGDLISHDDLTDFVAAEHLSLPNTIANVLSNHNVTVHDALSIHHGSLFGLGDDDHAQYHNDTRGDTRYYTKSQINTYLEAQDELSEMDDVNITSPANNQVLVYNLSQAEWQNAGLPTHSHAHGDLTGVTSDQHHSEIHAISHKSAGGDAIRIDELKVATDVTTLNATTTYHGLLPKLYGGTARFLRADGTWATLPDADPTPHASDHEVGGDDLVSHDSLTDFLATEHFLQSAIVVVGTIVTGVWEGTDIAWTYVSKTGSNLTDLATRQHAGLTNVTSDQHHAQLHATEHHVAGGDLVNHDSLTGFVAAEHVSLPNTIANVLSNHNVTVHDALSIDHGSLFGKGDDDHTQYHNDTRGDVRYYTKTQINTYLEDQDELSEMDDVNITSPANNQVLAYNFSLSEWQNVDMPPHSHAHGDLTGVTDDQHHSKIHAVSHKSAGGDAIRVDELKEGTDVTTLDSTTTRHGLFPKLYGGTARFLRSDGVWATFPDADPTPHASDHEVGGDDLVSHDDLTDFVAGEHFLQSTITEVGTIVTGIWEGTDIAWAYVSKTGSNLTHLATRQHAGLTDVTSGQHHAQLHASEHEVGGGDLVSHDDLTDFLAAEHLSLPNTIANVLSDHTVAVHNALDITELGTVSSGVWQGTPIANAYVAGINQNLLTTSSPTFDGIILATGSGVRFTDYHKIYQQTYSVNVTTPATLIDDTDTAFSVTKSYRVKAVVVSTGTSTGAVAVFRGDGTNFTLFKNFEAGTSSNHIEFYLDAGVPKVRTWHANLYTVSVLTEEIYNKGWAFGPEINLYGNVAGDLTVRNQLTIGAIVAGATDYDKFLVSHGGLVKYRTGAQVLSDIGASGSGHSHAHSAITDVTSDQHHAQLHASSHEVGGGDLISHDDLTDFVAAEHLSLPNTIANVLSNHNVTVHDALSIHHGSLFGLGDDDHAQYHNDTRGDTRYYTKTQINTYLEAQDELAEMDDVNIGSPQDNQVLTYSSGEWINAAIGAHAHAHGDLSGITDDQHHSKIHAASHKSAGGDAIRIDELKVATDITTLNATTSYHGLLPKLYGGSVRFLRADGTWAITPGGTPDPHASDHEVGGSDLVGHDLLTGFVAAEHVSLPNSMANVINSGHDVDLHDALSIHHGSLFGLGDDDHSQYYNSARHTVAVHNALDITELGTVSSGVWQGTAIANAYIAGINQNLLTSSSPTFDNVLISSGDGDGIKFWASNSYKIYMSQDYGTEHYASDYNMYFTMTGGTNRGFVFMSGTTPNFQIDAAGNIWANNNAVIDGDLTVSGASTNFRNAIKAVDGSGSLIDADKVDGEHASAIVTKARIDAQSADHGALSGRGDDDHSQYYNSTRHTKAIHDALNIDADTLDSLSSGSFLRSNADDYLYNAIIVPDANRDEGIFGTYVSTKTQHIWSMGTAYRNSPTGAGFGNLYGLAYKYNGVAGGHGVYLVNNGVQKSALGLDVWTSGRFISTLATGTAPLTVASTTKVANLNADLLENQHASMVAGNNTIVQRNASGYIYCNYLNTTSGETTNEPTHYFVESGNDSFLRQMTPANFVAKLAADGLMPKAGGTFTGYVYASNHGAAATDMVVNVCYGTGSPPAVGGTTHGTIFLKYTA